MPRFFIDTTDGDTRSHDREGEDFVDADTTERCALAHLPALSDVLLPSGEIRDFSVTLRGESGAALYVACLSYHGAWISNSLRRAG